MLLHFQMKSIADYEKLKKVNIARSKTQSRFVRDELMDNVREYSNGESAFLYFTEKIEENVRTYYEFFKRYKKEFYLVNSII